MEELNEQLIAYASQARARHGNLVTVVLNFEVGPQAQEAAERAASSAPVEARAERQPAQSQSIEPHGR